jgi:hypothetical protein
MNWRSRRFRENRRGGFEVEVLRAMMAIIERCGPIFMIEYYPGDMAGIGEILHPFGNRAYVFDRHANAFRPHDDREADELFYLPPAQRGSLPISGISV